MAGKPYTWVSWSEARFRMFEIWNGWSESVWCDHADRAFANVLRRRNVSYCGEARENSLDYTSRLSRTPIRLENVVAGLLSVTSYGRAEYERARLKAAPAWDKFDTAPRSIVENAVADVSGAELVWEEFRDKLIKYELPAGAVPNPDPTEASEGGTKPNRRRNRAAVKRTGPKAGAIRRYEQADCALFPEIERLMRCKNLSHREAAMKLAADGKVAGRGTNDSRGRRLADLYKSKHKRQQS